MPKILHYRFSRLQLVLKRELVALLGRLLRLRLIFQSVRWPEKVQGTVVMIDRCLGLGDVLMISPAMRILLDYGPVTVVAHWPRLLDAGLTWRVTGSWHEQRAAVNHLTATGYVVLVPFTGLRGLLVLLTWPGRLPPGVVVLNDRHWLDTVSGTLGTVVGSHYSDPPLAAAQGLVRRLTGTTPFGRVPRLPPLRIEPAALVIPDSPFVVLAPWASAAIRRWPLPHWAELIGQLVRERPDLPLVLIGTAAERDHTKAIVANAKTGTIINLMGQLTLAETATVIARAGVLVCCDSGPMHMALGFDTPVVAIFGSTDPTARLHGHRATAVADPALCPSRLAPCYAGFQREPICPTHIECLIGLSPGRVAVQVLKQLAAFPGNP